MGSFLSSESDKNADPRSEDTKETTEEKEERSQKKESVCASKTRVPNKTAYVYKRNTKRKNKKKDF